VCLLRVLGEVISSYPVEDKAQVADLDPSMFLELPDEDLEAQTCQVCEEDDNEDVLMYCDGCQKLWHTYCVGLQEVPYGHWFCDHCRAQRELNPRAFQSQTSSRAGHRPSNRRTRGQQRRHRSQNQANDSSWTQVWQSVWDRIHLDLDFPYDDEESAATYMRCHRQRNEANRREQYAWQRRMEVAELHGAGGRFRETESTLLDHRPGHNLLNRPSAQQPQTATGESTEELVAWHAYEEAIAADSSTPPSRKKKRKSASASPTESDATPTGRPVKRVRPSRPEAPTEASRSSTASIIRRRPSPRPSSPPRRLQQTNSSSGPSFLQSLLKEVEDSSMPNHGGRLYRPLALTGQSPPTEQHSPQPSSPALSPLPSNHSSPRAMSATPPPPHPHNRPNSPTGLSSSIQPVYPVNEGPPLQFSPEPQQNDSEARAPSANAAKARYPVKLAHPTPISRIPRALQHSSQPPSRPRSSEASPTRANLSFSAKSDVQKMVSAALKPFYNEHIISKDEYTNVNRDTCHKLYDKIGDFEALDVEGKARWEKVAGEEVTKAVGALKGTAVVTSGS
jgi:hypothetical protein